MAGSINSRRNPPFVPGQTEPYKLSRSKIELFTQCPRCFWLDVRYKISRPSSPPFQINKAIDELYKKEFDFFRANGQPHPVMTKNKIDAVPFQHKELDKWRHNFSGVSILHDETNLHLFGAVDDVWVDKDGDLIVVDYKATSKTSEVNLDSDWQITYKRQMEIYQWLLRKNGFKVSNTGYFVYTNARVDLDGFNDTLQFRTKVISYAGDDSWIEPKIIEMKKCMEGGIPKTGISIMGGPCEYCSYASKRVTNTLQFLDEKNIAVKDALKQLK